MNDADKIELFEKVILTKYFCQGLCDGQALLSAGCPALGSAPMLKVI